MPKQNCLCRGHQTWSWRASVLQSLAPTCFRCVWLGLELSSAGHRPSRTVSDDPCASGTVDDLLLLPSYFFCLPLHFCIRKPHKCTILVHFHIWFKYKCIDKFITCDECHFAILLQKIFRHNPKMNVRSGCSYGRVQRGRFWALYSEKYT